MLDGAESEAAPRAGPVGGPARARDFVGANQGHLGAEDRPAQESLGGGMAQASALDLRRILGPADDRVRSVDDGYVRRGCDAGASAPTSARWTGMDRLHHLPA